MGKIINRVRERAIEARRTKLLKEQMNQPLVLEVQPVDRSRAARKERVAVCEALGLEPWADLDKAIIPAIEGLKAAVRQLRNEPQAPKAVPIGQERFEFDSLIIEVNGSTSKLIAKKGAEVVHTSTDKIKGHGIPDNLTLLLMYGGFKAVSEPVRIGDWSPKSHE